MSILLDYGPHTVKLFMEEVVDDSRGNEIRRPMAQPVTITGCLVIPVSSSRGAFPAIDVRQGQRVDGAWRFMAREAPLGWWSRIEWFRAGGAPVDLLRFTVLGGPLRHGVTSTSGHISASLREER